MAMSEKAIEDIMSDSALWQEIEQFTLDAARPIFEEIFMGGVRAGAIIAARMGSKAEGDDDPEEFIRVVASADFGARAAMVLAAYEAEWWQALSRTVRRQLLDAIIDAREQGTSVRDIKKKIEPLFGKERASRIAVTETTRLFGAGAQESYRALGMEMWEWRTAEDDRVDPTCDQLAAGSPYPMSSAFFPAHVNCRCWPVPFIEETPKKEAA